MWSLSLPQVAATLAGALVAYESVNSAGERLIGESVLDCVLVLVMVTAVFGPILTQLTIRALTAEESPYSKES